MATPISWAQEVITCDLCDNPTQQFCNSCQVSLCLNCINKHVDKFKSLTHDIVPFKNRIMQMVLPECEFHSHQRCEAHCQRCDVPVCMKCIITSHNGHNVGGLPKIFIEKREEIEKEIQEIESTIIPMYREKNEETEMKVSKSTARFNEIEKEIEIHRKSWHNEVDIIFDTLDTLIKSMKENHLAALKSHQSRLKKLTPDMIQTVQQNKKILKSNKVSEVTNYRSNLAEYRNILADIDQTFPSLKTNTVQGSELSVELGEYKATLTQTSLSSLTEEVFFSSTGKLLDKARVIATIPTGGRPIFRVVCVGAEKAWVSGLDRTIRCVDIHGFVQEIVNIYLLCPDDIAVTRQGELIYSDAENMSVSIVRHGKTEIIITTQEGWKPRGLCCTRSGDILVNLHNGIQNKIVRYQGKTVKQEICKTYNEKKIFENGDYRLLVAENNIGDVCVSDRNANAVVVVDKIGRVRFRYNGTPARGKNVFSPRKIVTDSMSQIIVADYSNDSLHILDQDGQLLKCVDNCGLCGPCGLSVDNEGRLWVGEMHSGEVKVIQYMM